eukprot:16171245-Heterocapsa_arctica.AAC.1
MPAVTEYSHNKRFASRTLPPVVLRKVRDGLLGLPTILTWVAPSLFWIFSLIHVDEKKGLLCSG